MDVGEHLAAVRTTQAALGALRSGRPQDVPTVAAPLPMVLDPAERALGVGAFDLQSFGADLQSAEDELTEVPCWADIDVPLSRFVPGAPTVTVTALASGIEMLSDAPRRARITDAVKLRWRTTHRGRVQVTTHGMYLDHGTVVHPWPWHLLDQGRLMAPGTFQYMSRSTTGGEPWRLVSVWAELAFVLWAWHRDPGHRTLRDDAWVPPLREPVTWMPDATAPAAPTVAAPPTAAAPPVPAPPPSAARVAPADPLLDEGQVVVGPADADGEERRSRVDQRIRDLLGRRLDADRPLDR